LVLSREVACRWAASGLWSVWLRVGVYVAALGFLVWFAGFRVFILYSGDEELYREVGVEYVGGTPPAGLNFEHPPLAKYVIGWCIVAGVGRVCSAFFAWLALVGLGEAAWLLGLRGRGWLGLVAAVLTDPLLLGISKLYMLDVYMLGFFGAALPLVVGLLSGRGGALRAAGAGALLGAAFASKMLCLLPCLAAVLALTRRRGLRLAAVAVAAAGLVYLASYAADFAAGGPGLVVEHHLEMYRYMSIRHGFSAPLAANGWLLYFARVELWKDIGSVSLVFDEEGRLVSVTYNFTGPRVYYRFQPYLGSLLLPLSPVAALSVGGVAALLHLSSLWVLVYGPIWWYLVLPAYTGHLVLGLWLSRRRLGWLLHAASSAAALLLALQPLLLRILAG